MGKYEAVGFKDGAEGTGSREGECRGRLGEGKVIKGVRRGRREEIKRTMQGRREREREKQDREKQK